MYRYFLSYVRIVRCIGITEFSDILLAETNNTVNILLPELMIPVSLKYMRLTGIVLFYGFYGKLRPIK